MGVSVGVTDPPQPHSVLRRQLGLSSETKSYSGRVWVQGPSLGEGHKLSCAVQDRIGSTVTAPRIPSSW